VPGTVATDRADRAARPRSWPAALAWALFALVLLLFATYPLLDRMVRDAGRPDLALFAPFVVAPTLAALTASTVGWVLASRRPRHPVGWLLLTLGLVLLLTPTGSAPMGLRLLSRHGRAGGGGHRRAGVGGRPRPQHRGARRPHAFGGALAVFNQLALATASSSSLAGPARW
jgi:hypothetical protein